MGIAVTCTGCKLRLTLGEHWAGKVFKCMKCGTGLPVPAAEPLDFPSEEPARVNLLPWVVGGVAVLLLAVAVTLVALRKPAEVAQSSDPPSPAPLAAPVVTPKPETATLTPVAVVPERTALAPREMTPPREANPPRPTEPPGTGAGRPAVIPELPPVKAEFLGSEGTGRRFCIIADNSGSMSGAKIADLRSQLLKSIADLDKSGGNFFIYCFNTNPEPMPHTGWLRGGSPEVGNIRTWVSGIKSTGGTRPLPAFEAAFAMNPRPDVIFFMTDGQIPSNVPEKVAALNTGTTKVVVNTIMFEASRTTTAAPKSVVAPKTGGTANRAETQLKQIADQSGGTFTRYAPKN